MKTYEQLLEVKRELISLKLHEVNLAIAGLEACKYNEIVKLCDLRDEQREIYEKINLLCKDFKETDYDLHFSKIELLSQMREELDKFQSFMNKKFTYLSSKK